LLVDDGVLLFKYWLTTDQAQQEERLAERLDDPLKRWKLTDEDWRNREKAGAYHEAVCDMVDRTSTGTAPWTIVESNDKYFARVKVLRTICERLEKELKIDLAKEPRMVITRGATDEAGKDGQPAPAKQAPKTKAERAKELRAEKARAAKQAKELAASEAREKATAAKEAKAAKAAENGEKARPTA